MYTVIDFRNGRYQGQTKNQLPHGLGIFINKDWLFCLGEWLSGELVGLAFLVFPSGKIFCGRINLRQADQLCSYELVDDHVKLFTVVRPRKQGHVIKIAALLPLLQIILEIDNTQPLQARVIAQYQYSLANEQTNISTISKILHLDNDGSKTLMSFKNCIQFFIDHFLNPFPHVFEFIVGENRGKKEYFFGIKGEGLGIKIEPLEDLALNVKKTGRVYLIRGMGYFTIQNQLKDFGFKVIDNAMKGYIAQEGIYSLPQTITKYEFGKRPSECRANFCNYLKRSTKYRQKFIQVKYILELQNYVFGFNQNLKKIQTQKIAQFTIQNPNNDGNNLAQIQHRRRQKQKQADNFIKTKTIISENSNIYPENIKITDPQFNLERAKQEIYRSVSKKKTHTDHPQYRNAQYIDHNKKTPSYLSSNKVLPNYEYIKRVARPGQITHTERKPETYKYLQNDQPYYRSKPLNNVSPKPFRLYDVQSPKNLYNNKFQNHANHDRKMSPISIVKNPYLADSPEKQIDNKVSFNLKNNDNNYTSPSRPRRIPTQVQTQVKRDRFLDETNNSDALSYNKKIPKYKYQFEDDPAIAIEKMMPQQPKRYLQYKPSPIKHQSKRIFTDNSFT